MSTIKPGTILASTGIKRKVDEKTEPQFKKRGIFTKDLRMMMFGFGDVEHPLQRTVDTVEDILVDFISDFVHDAMEQATKTGKVQKEDLLFQVRKDSRKFNRAMELLYLEEKIKEAKQLFNSDAEVLEKDPNAAVGIVEGVGGDEGAGEGAGGGGVPRTPTKPAPPM